jgi:hypothetical protein
MPRGGSLGAAICLVSLLFANRTTTKPLFVKLPVFEIDFSWGQFYGSEICPLQANGLTFPGQNPIIITWEEEAAM